jgi:hypothetical protein
MAVRGGHARATFWGGTAPIVIGLGALVHPAALSGVLVYFVPHCVWPGPTSSQSWAYALFVTAAKFAELQGILKFR